jgi:hypothetical protein
MVVDREPLSPYSNIFAYKQIWLTMSYK